MRTALAPWNKNYCIFFWAQLRRLILKQRSRIVVSLEPHTYQLKGRDSTNSTLLPYLVILLCFSLSCRSRSGWFQRVVWRRVTRPWSPWEWFRTTRRECTPWSGIRVQRTYSPPAAPTALWEQHFVWYIIFHSRANLHNGKFNCHFLELKICDS